MKVCPNCQKKIQDKVAICPYCGKPVSPSLMSRIMSSTKYRVGLIAGIIGLVVLLSGGIYFASRNGLFAPKASCYEQSQAYLNEFMPLFSQWMETNQNINNLRKADVEVMEYSMETIRDQVSALTPPQCALKVHQFFMAYMDSTLDGYNALISGDTGVTVKKYIDTAANYYDQYRAQVLELYPELSSVPIATP